MSNIKPVAADGQRKHAFVTLLSEYLKAPPDLQQLVLDHARRSAEENQRRVEKVETTSAGAGGYAQKAEGHGLVAGTRRLMIPLAVGGQPMEGFLNQHVSRRTIMGASAGLAAISMPTAVAVAADGNLQTRQAGGVALELQALQKAFNVEFRTLNKHRKIFTAAEQRFFAMRPAQPKRTSLEEVNRAQDEAWDAAYEVARHKSGFAAVDKAFVAQFRRTDRAAGRILRFKAVSLEDIQIKLEVHGRWVFDEGDKITQVLGSDIRRVAKAQRSNVSRGTAAVTG
ncbi:hypothetical protein EN851_03580 [Mesorhizobium sp. M8A.F.Ca.ET.208.01.1.1]|uniref:hypothetical protein n=1 Tax=unclassified Mesorhizobium TaxID=325217 RepID=UPI001093F276|nr:MULTISPECIES: hypothetical protein [unclassified Mesorhizobium]TGQ94646.1 hypothetical protein EN851_03580 [Mesorhizobium sp. M8A.F.Ca.ET.208.01.1.1]TGT55133.1 hypothetical protein EN810_03580 [Mesorhizobium sp. M8A.F.Ca.ET.167.01.1.1]